MRSTAPPASPTSTCPPVDTTTSRRKIMILITGATGKIASRVVHSLLAADQDVRALSRDADRARSALGPDVDVVAGEWSEASVLDRALDGVDHVFLAVGTTPGQDELEKLVIDAADRSAARPHVVKLSTYGADKAGSELPPYQVAAWHRSSEAHLQATGLPATVLRPNAYMDNLLASAGTIAGQDALYSSTGQGRVSMVDTRDVADVAVAVLTTPGHEGLAYPITGGRAVDSAAIVEVLTRVLGRDISFVPVDEATVEGALSGLGIPSALVPVFLEGHRLIEHSVFETVEDDVRLRLTGTPRRSLEEFVGTWAAAFGGSLVAT